MDTTEAWNTMHQMLRGFAASMPRFVLAIVLAAVFFVLGWIIRRGMERKTSADSSHRTLKLALGRIAHGVISVIGLLIAIAAAFPGFTPGNLVSALGVGGIAVGFAFKDIFENFLAGILILITHPFRIGDQIVYDKYEGTVEDIHIRATWLKTYDGRRIVIPNSDLFTHPVTVNTAFENRRLEYEFKIRNGADADQAKKIVEDLLDDAEGVLPDPRADVVVTSFDDSSVTLKARWWSRSRIGDVLIAQDQVLSMMWRALEKAQIVLSSQAAQVVLHPSSTTSGGANVLPPVAAASASEAEDGSQPET